MKIGMILDKHFPPDTRVQNEALGLLGFSHDVHILCFDYSRKLPIHENINGIHVFRIRHSKKWVQRFRIFQHKFLNFYIKFWEKQVLKFARNHAIDVLHIHDLYMIPAGIKAARRLNIPIVADLHENYAAALKSYSWSQTPAGRLIVRPNSWENLEEEYLKYPRKLIVLSDLYKNSLLQKYSFLNHGDIFVYENVPRLSEFSTYKINHQILNKNGNFLVLYFGIIAERRGIFTALEALNLLIQQGRKNIKLLLIGPVDHLDREKFNNYIEVHKLTDNIIHYYWKDIALLPSYISVSDICISPIFKNPQHESGVANKIFQYMLYERPLIVSDCAPQQVIVETENCGIVHKSGNSLDLSEKIAFLQDNPKIRKTLGINGKKAVLNKYNSELMSQRLKELYQSLKPE